jgi:hypothetical protein
MTLLDQIKASNAWDARYGLPLLPANNNPWIYMAYLDTLMQFRGERLDRELVWQHFLRCEVEGEPGLFHRWPGGYGGMNSHDEIMGAAYFDPRIADRILRRLDRKFGDFNNTGEKPSRALEYNVYRFGVWLRPYLASRAGRCIVISPAWAAHLAYATRDNDGDNCGGRLRNWLMMHEMQRYAICRPAIRGWIKRREERGETLRGSLEIEPRETPILGELAPLEWRLLSASRS